MATTMKAITQPCNTLFQVEYWIFYCIVLLPYEKHFSVCSKADITQPSLLHGTKLKKYKTDMLRGISNQSTESVESVLKKKRKAMVGRICRKRF